jgi:hypothetical protein
MFWEINPFYSENHAMHINTLCRLNVKFAVLKEVAYAVILCFKELIVLGSVSD